MSVSERELARRLRNARAPSEGASEQRAWEVARAAYVARPARSRRRTRARLVLVPVVIAVVGVLALTPAGATVHRWIEQTLGVRHARTALFSLPSGGRILVSGRGGAWTVAADGSRRRLGPWPTATWSSHGLYVAVASANELRAVDDRGTTRWSLARPSVRFPRWFAPDGYRVAYLSRSTLRVVAGDGTGDHELAGGVAGVAPAWRAGHPYQLAYVADGGRTVVVRNTDPPGVVVWSHRLPAPARLLSWSADGSRLLVVSGDGTVAVYGGNGNLVARLSPSAGERPIDAALSPDGHMLALLTDHDVSLIDLSSGGSEPARRLFSGQGLRQLAWSPDGQWLLVSWPAADQWIFLHAGGRPRLIAVSRIAQQFGAAGGTHFPRLDGWCCTASGGPG
jgi:hypothetical protein